MGSGLRDGLGGLAQRATSGIGGVFLLVAGGLGCRWGEGLHDVGLSLAVVVHDQDTIAAHKPIAWAVAAHLEDEVVAFHLDGGLAERGVDAARGEQGGLADDARAESPWGRVKQGLKGAHAEVGDDEAHENGDGHGSDGERQQGDGADAPDVSVEPGQQEARHPSP